MADLVFRQGIDPSVTIWNGIGLQKSADNVVSATAGNYWSNTVLRMS